MSSFAADTQGAEPGKSHSPINGKDEQISSDGDSTEEVDFNWEEYLEENGADPAPHTSFKHVELSLQSSFQPGMKLEVANKSNPDTYWVATIITTCGQLLLLRFCGYGEERKADFWCDVMTADLHPVGWCAQNNKVLMPPEDNVYLRKAIKERYSDWAEFLMQELTGARTAPANLLEGPLRGKNTVDMITGGSLLELQDVCNPFLYWAVRVVENVGGRLRLRLVGLEDNHAHDTWLFYLDIRLRPVGWCQENHFSMDPPPELRDLKSAPEWQEALEQARTEVEQKPLPLEVFKDHADLCRHSFKAGMTLEMVSPREPFHICPMSVTQVYNEHYFQVMVVDLSVEATPLSVVCHAQSPGILPAQWCLKNGVSLERPRGYPGPDFDWADYLKQNGSEAAPDSCFSEVRPKGFCKGMWLEAVNPTRPSQICVASISRASGNLLWLRLEGLPTTLPDCIVDAESMDIFPLGWCEANGYPLTPPHKPVCQKQRKIAVVQPEKQLVPPQSVESSLPTLCSSQTQDTGSANGKYCCSQIFVNHRCFSGPYLNKGRIAELPQAVGPGKCALVLKEVLSMLINAAYKPGRVLRELQLVEDPLWNFQEETLKAKYKGKTYRSTIKIVRRSDQVSDFCRKVCLKLQCCPNLFSPMLVTDKCPENCSVQTKTKYTYYYGKKRKVALASVDEASPESGLSKPARRRKKRKSIFVKKKRRSSAVDYTPAGSPEDSEEDEDGEDQSGSDEGTSSEPRGDLTDTSSVEASVSRRPRRAVTLRRSTDPGGSDAHTGTERVRRKRSTRSLSSTEATKYHPAKRQVTKVEGGDEEDKLVLDSNPLEWTVADVVQFIRSTDCAPLAKIFQEQDIDGQALLLLTLPTVQECMDLKLGPAIKLCHQIERVKVAFYAQYAN